MTLLKRRQQQNDFLGFVGRMEGQIREDTWQEEMALKVLLRSQ